MLPRSSVQLNDSTSPKTANLMSYGHRAHWYVTHLYWTPPPVLWTSAKAQGQTEWDPVAWEESYFEPITTFWALLCVTTATSRHPPVLCRLTLITLSTQVTQHCRRSALKGVTHRRKYTPSFVDVNMYKPLTLYRTWSLHTPPVWTFRRPVVNKTTYSFEHNKGLIRIVPLYVFYMFRSVLRPSSGMSTQKSYKGQYNKI